MSPFPLAGNSVVVAGVNPHRLGFAGALETVFTIELHGTPVRYEDVLMKSLVTCQEHLHQSRANAAPLVLRKHEHVGVVNDEVSVRESVTESNQAVAIPGGDERMRSHEGLVQEIGLLR